jgi:dolichyl-phosphate-mannose-protein mannosyltransferase
LTKILTILHEAGRVADAYDRLDSWCAERSRWIIGAGVSLGLLLRIWTASLYPLTADEAWQCLIANAGGLRETFAAANLTNHPPLVVLAIRLMKVLGNGDVWLRVVPVVAGGLTPLVVYLWLRRRYGRTEALFAGLVLALSPALIKLSAAISGHTLAILFMALALYTLERSIDERSSSWMHLFNVSLLLAAVSEIMTTFFLVAAGCYFLIRMFEPKVTWPMKLVWGGGQVAAIALYHFTYSRRIGDLIHMRLDPAYYAGWLGQSFPQFGESPYPFLTGGTLKQFLFLIPSLPTALLGLLLFTVAVFVLFRRETTGSVAMATLLMAPFAAAALAAFARVYPYGMLAQTSCLVLLAAAGIGIGLGMLLCRRVIPALVLALLFVPLWHLQGAPGERKAALAASVKIVRKSIPSGSLVLSDAESRLILGHYLAPKEGAAEVVRLPREDTVAGIRWFIARWSHGPDGGLESDLKLMSDTYPDLSGQVWVIRDGGLSITRSPLPTPEATSE